MFTLRPSRGKANRYEYTIHFRWPDGSRFVERRNAPVTGRAAALRWVQARETELLAKGPAPAPARPLERVPTLAEFWPRVLSDHYQANRKKPSTIASAEGAYRSHLAPLFGSTRLDAIDRASYAALKGRLASRSPKTVNNVACVLSRVLKCAVEWGLLEKRPKVDILPVPPQRARWYEPHEFRRLVEGARKVSTEALVLVLLGGRAGLRRGELAALQWCNVDLERRVLRVDASMWRKESGTTKSGRARDVPIGEELLRALKAHRHLGDRVLFRDERGERACFHVLRAAQRRAGLEANGAVHMLRHTFCSHLAAAGVPAKAIQELAGHTDLKTTLRYMHLSPANRSAAICALAALDGAAESVSLTRTEMAGA